MHIRLNKRRLVIDPVCGEHEIYNFVVKRLAWPKKRVFLEWTDDQFTEILNLEELRLACRLVSDYLYNETKDWVVGMTNLKIFLQLEIENKPDDAVTPEIQSDDDLTMDDYYAMGFRHEIVN
jgi:hypothetical protein